jgi:hypothetical protein
LVHGESNALRPKADRKNTRRSKLLEYARDREAMHFNHDQIRFRRDDAHRAQGRTTRSECTGEFVISQHALAPVGAHGQQSRRRQHSHLAHATTEQLARATRARDELGRSGEERSHRCTKSLREAQGRRVRVHG